MKVKIVFLYITAMLMLILCSCSEITETASGELRSGKWISSEDSFSLKFKGDDAVITLKDNKNRVTRISGTTIVTDNTITIYDSSTLNEYKLEYKIFGDKVTLNYQGKELELNAHS